MAKYRRNNSERVLGVGRRFLAASKTFWIITLVSLILAILLGAAVLILALSSGVRDNPFGRTGLYNAGIALILVYAAVSLGGLAVMSVSIAIVTRYIGFHYLGIGQIAVNTDCLNDILNEMKRSGGQLPQNLKPGVIAAAPAQKNQFIQPKLGSEAIPGYCPECGKRLPPAQGGRLHCSSCGWSRYTGDAANAQDKPADAQFPPNPTV